MTAPSAVPETRSSTSDHPDTPPARESRLGISTTQVAGSALAAVSAAVSASWLGVAGTVVGAALGSVFATVGSALYAHSLRQGSTAVRRSVRLSRTGRQEVQPPPVRRSRLREALAALPDLPWRRLALGTLAALALGLAALTVVEGLTGRSVSGGDDADGRTTVGRLLGGGDGGGTVTDSVDSPAREVLQTPARTVEGGTATTEPTPSGAADPTEPSDAATEAPAADPTAEPTAEPSESSPAAEPTEPTEPTEPQPSQSPTDPVSP